MVLSERRFSSDHKSIEIGIRPHQGFDGGLFALPPISPCFRTFLLTNLLPRALPGITPLSTQMTQRQELVCVTAL